MANSHDSTEPVAWAVYWGLPPTRKNSVHFDKESAQAVANQIKSATEVRPLYAAPVAQQPSKATLEKLRAWETNGELIDRAWQVLQSQEQEIMRLEKMLAEERTQQPQAEHEKAPEAFATGAAGSTERPSVLPDVPILAQAVPLLSEAEVGEIVNANWGVGVSQMARAIEQAVRAQAITKALAPQQAEAVPLHQALTDPENQPNQYGVEFLMHGPKFAFKVGTQQFTLDYEPTEPGDFEFMRDALIRAFSVFTEAK